MDYIPIFGSLFWRVLSLSYKPLGHTKRKLARPPSQSGIKPMPLGCFMKWTCLISLEEEGLSCWWQVLQMQAIFFNTTISV